MPLKPETRESLKLLYNSLRDRPLPPGDAAYVPEVNVPGPEAPDVVEEIATEIEWQEGGGVCLFTGQRGTGKSTELLRLQKRLQSDDSLVLLADMSEYILLTKPIEISDFLVSMCGAVSEKIETAVGGSPGNQSYWQRLRQFLDSKVELKDIGATVGVVEIKAALKSDPSFKQKMQEGMRGHVAQLMQEAHKFLQEAVAYVRAKKGRPELKLVLLLDSVERIRGVGSDDMQVFDSVRNLFFGHSDALKVPMLHIVYTVPPYLTVVSAGAGALVGGAATRRLRLVSIHIFKDRSRDPDPAGLAVMRKVLTARHSSWDKVFGAEALDKLAIVSGGDLREFFRLIRLCLPAVRDDSQLPLSAHAVSAAVNAARNELLPIPLDHLDWLQRISKSYAPCLDRDGMLPVLANFLDNRLVLNYRTSADWYGVHPLLHEVVDDHQPHPAT